jgi:hypothetical protein
MCREAFAEVDRFAGGAIQFDDITVMAVGFRRTDDRGQRAERVDDRGQIPRRQ